MLPMLTCFLLACSPVDLLTVRGTLQDGTGQPVARALVRILPIDSRAQVDGAAAVSGMSEPDGSFELVLNEAPHALRLDVRAPGFAPSLLDRIELNQSEIDVGPLLLLRGIAITGRIDDPDGEPINGARIFVRSAFHRGLKEISFEPEATTDENGLYRIEGLPAGKISVGAAAEGRVFTVAENVDISDPFLRQIDFSLETARTYRGSVSHAGQSVSGALIEVRGERGPDVFFREFVGCDPQGRFSIPGLPESWDDLLLRITAAGLNPMEFPVASPPTSGEHVLGSAAAVRIETTADGDAPAILRIEFEVYMRSQDGWTREDGLVTEEDAQVLAPDVWVVHVPAGDAARFVVHSVDGRHSRTDDVRLKDPHRLVVAVFPTRLSISGRIVSKGSEAPENRDQMAGLRVELGATARPSGSFRIARVTLSDGQGRFRFDDLDPGTYAVRAFSEEGISEPVRFHLDPDEDSETLEIHPIRPAVIQGHLTINGKNHGTSVLIRAYRFFRASRGGSWREVATARTDERGAFRIGPLLAGSIALVPVRPPEAADGAQRDRSFERAPALEQSWPWVVRLEEGDATRFDLDFPLPERAWLIGTIRINGEPRAGLPLTFRSVDEQSSDSIKSGRSGRFRFRFEGSGRYELALRAGALSTSFALELEEGVDRLSDLNLNAGEVRGRIRLPDSPQRTRVRLERRVETTAAEEPPWEAKALTMPDEEGSFRFLEVLEGTGRVVVLDDSKRFATVASDPFPIRAGQVIELPDLSLSPGNTLTAILKGPAGEKLPFATLELRAAPGERELPEPHVAWFVADSATVHGLPPGKLIARVSPYGKWTASSEQTVLMPSDGSVVTVEFLVTKRNP